MSHSNYTPDDSAVHWMIVPNFRDGNEMDRSNTPFDEFRYQHRGYSKYADIVRLFGWEVFTTFYYTESIAENEGRKFGDWPKYDSLSYEDSRTLEWSVQAKQDLTPLLEFWGIHPDN
jgi:hypothetical protein